MQSKHFHLEKDVFFCQDFILYKNICMDSYATCSCFFFLSIYSLFIRSLSNCVYSMFSILQVRMCYCELNHSKLHQNDVRLGLKKTRQIKNREGSFLLLLNNNKKTTKSLSTCSGITEKKNNKLEMITDITETMAFNNVKN